MLLLLNKLFHIKIWSRNVSRKCQLLVKWCFLCVVWLALLSFMTESMWYFVCWGQPALCHQAWTCHTTTGCSLLNNRPLFNIAYRLSIKRPRRKVSWLLSTESVQAKKASQSLMAKEVLTDFYEYLFQYLLSNFFYLLPPLHKLCCLLTDVHRKCLC